MNDQSRRDFLAFTGTALAGAAAASAYQAPKKLYAYVSSWTKGPFGQGGGGGIAAFTINMSDGSLMQVFKTGAEFDGLNGGDQCMPPHGRVFFCTHQAPEPPRQHRRGGGGQS